MVIDCTDRREFEIRVENLLSLYPYLWVYSSSENNHRIT